MDKVRTGTLVVDVPAMAPFPELTGDGGFSEFRPSDTLQPGFPWLTTLLQSLLQHLHTFQVSLTPPMLRSSLPSSQFRREPPSCRAMLAFEPLQSLATQSSARPRQRIRSFRALQHSDYQLSLPQRRNQFLPALQERPNQSFPALAPLQETRSFTSA